MKKIFVYILLTLLLSSLKMYSQEVFQQTTIELGEALDDGKTYLCSATSSIELLPGFNYNPKSNNKMLLDIDRYSVFPPTDGIYGGNANDEECVVGSIPSTFDVSSTGAATYSVDIQLPPALDGMSPKLSLAYNSQGTNGLLGWSWNLLGISSIERVGQTEYYDGGITDVDFKNDRYVLDGQRLMSVGDNTYKTEIDNYDKIVAYHGNVNGPSYFVVWKSDGTIWEYGASADSKIEPQNDRNVALKWLLSRIYDRNGNTITYHYHEDTSTGEAYIKDIEYASNEKVNVLPAYKVAFQYENRFDLKEGYVHGNKVSDGKLLKNIDVYNNYTGEKIIEYSMLYHEPAYYDNNYYMYYRLKSIQLTIDGKKVNPTQIIWNSKDKWDTDNSCGYKKYELDKSMFNKSSFVGDFNGDGLSDVLLLPYKMQNVYPSDVCGEVYLNNGDGGFDRNPLTKIMFSKYIDWIYVVDINGDGNDDIIPYEIHCDDAGVFKHSRYSMLLMTDGVFLKDMSFESDKPLVLLPGNYFDKERKTLLVLDAYDGNKNKENARCVFYQQGFCLNVEVRNSNVINGKDISALVMDMSGDGVSDLLSLDDAGYKVYKLKSEVEYLSLEAYCSGNSMTNKIYPFPNDYNGDGKVDMLYYDPAHFWNIAFSKGTDFMDAELFVNNDLLRYVRLNSKDKYCYSLKEMQKPAVAIRTADFDGDGTADVGVFSNSGGNYYLEIGFFIKKANVANYNFSHRKRYYMPINYSHQTIQIGRFLPQENVSILSCLPQKPSSAAKAYVVSINPNSAYYSVEQIVDGMGNSMELSYDYLFPEKVAKSPFYICNSSDVYDVKTVSVPMLALKELKTYNVNAKEMVKRYSYVDAFVHKKGHGFMGFRRVVVREYVDGALVRRQQQEYELETMGSHCIPMLYSNRLFYGENQLVEDCSFAYTKYTCASNDKVVVPLLLIEQDMSYDVDKKDVVIKNVVAENFYKSDVGLDKSYNRLVQLTSSRKYYNDVKSIMDLKTSQYVEEVQMTYNDDERNWLVNRPEKIIRSVQDKAGIMVGDVKLIEYDVNSPTKISKETMIPNVYGDVKDSLTLVVDYKYDRLGNMIEQRMSSPSLKVDKITKSEYGVKYQYRYKTKSIDELGREILCEYDDFGILKSTKDYNGFITYMNNGPFGTLNEIETPDGMRNVKAVRWSEGNRYAPQNATYYLWEKSTGKAETMTFYHKSGAELRRVTFGLNGEPIFVDKIYDNFGNVRQESYPYYENDDRHYVANVYDMYNRKVETVHPNGMRVSFMYDGNDVDVEYHVADGMRKYRKESYNMMGWLINAIDDGGNEVRYEYYSDGLLKAAQIGNERNTRVELTYDNRRNKASLFDPNCGLVSYKNDALGNMLKIVSAQDIVEYEYDVLGRMVSKVETNIAHKKMNTIRWEYGRNRGEDGVLTRITANNHQLEYEYDEKLRVVGTTEIVNGVKYKMSYSYDGANRISNVVYPSGLEVMKKYSNSGYERMICDAGTDAVLWKTNKTDPKGYITEYQTGNGIKTFYSYDPRNYMIENILTTKGDKILQNMEYEYDAMCNLTKRCDLKNYNCEEFEYDDYDRLTKMILNGNVSGTMKYSANGNISEKEINGIKVMYNAVYAVDKPNAVVKIHSDDDRMYERFDQSIGYSVYDNVVSIEEEDKSLSMVYGYDNKRIYMRNVARGKVKEKTYVGDCEYVEIDGKKIILTYLKGPMGVFAVHVYDGDEVVHYVHKDNLGSWNVITDENGGLVKELSFDAWGNMRNPIDWSEEADDEMLLYDRGFTGHEHLVDFGLINMNGRLYDPLMSMMLSPDNNIQMPKSSQNFNRYSYCLNNPLKYTDPTGEWVESVVFGVVGGAANLMFNAKKVDSFGEAALLFGAGFVKGFLTEYTMGQSWFLQVGVGALSEGLVAGANSIVSISDGNFDFTGDEWNSVKTASCYGLGSGLVKSFMHSYFEEPTDTQYGKSFFESSYYREYAHGMTSLIAHGVGCWFSGQPFLSTMKFKDVGFDLSMLGIIANRLLSSYITKTGFGEGIIKQRAQDIKEELLQEMRIEVPETPDFEYEYVLLGVFVEDFRLYVVGNIFEIIPNEYGFFAPKPYFEEVVTFPFSYSLFRTLFFGDE